ncbi:S-adenosyl-L-methionine-dependent methyltransferase [Dendryphion nanum]|uniref:S-adenosyl-L-methionine-dependent methyltransferase n=1 Tax=Dendryphion nanum TaxID=256645 RepID=A0A9P9DNT5_9PLEO|nr:S-adenosyl-L-methionine-dependent methyltransferase [Dendryphion nanum]
MGSPSRLLELTAIIQDKTKEIDSYIRKHELPSPSFDPSYPPVFNLGDSEAARFAAIEAIDELKAHLLGPLGSLYDPVVEHARLSSLHVISKFRIAESFAQDKTTTADEIASKCGLPASEVKRMMRHAASYGLFQQPEKGVYAHTASTAAILSVPFLAPAIRTTLDTMWRSTPFIVDALIKYPGSQENNETPFSLSRKTNLGLFETLATDREMATDFAGAMSFLSGAPHMNAEHAVNGYDWSQHASSTIVDVGGSHGAIGFKLVEKWPSMKIIVQDRPEVVDTAPKDHKLVESGQVSFQVHDFFKPQPVKDADVYFLRQILHDWSDKYAIGILKALIPALKKGARIIINDQIPPEEGVLTPRQERPTLCYDMIMKQLFNAGERGEAEWRNLINQADERFNVIKAETPPGGQMGFVIVEWRG